MDCNNILQTEVRLIIQLTAVNGLDILVASVTDIYPVCLISFCIKIVEFRMVGILTEGAF